jgi:hypothetical protein
MAIERHHRQRREQRRANERPDHHRIIPGGTRAEVASRFQHQRPGSGRARLTARMTALLPTQGALRSASMRSAREPPAPGHRRRASRAPRGPGRGTSRGEPCSSAPQRRRHRPIASPRVIASAVAEASRVARRVCEPGFVDSAGVARMSARRRLGSHAMRRDRAASRRDPAS